MSNSCLIRWIENFLFGVSSSTSTLPLPPPEIRELVLRMEAEDIAWSHILYQGGFTAFPHQVHGDLNYLTDYLEKQWVFKMPFHEPHSFKTRAVSKFWSELEMLLSKRDEVPSPILPIPSKRDDDILKDMLEMGRPDAYAFQSAAFWGEVARRFVHLRRPETLAALPVVSNAISKRVLQLYEITCVARGQRFDPFNLVLVHHSEFVNAAHWQTSQCLEAFMHDRPTHPLTLSVQSLLKRTVEQVLHGEKPSAFLNPCPRLDAFLYNIRVIHDSVEKVSHPNTPPRLIDILQRLLALSYRDNLWEKVVPLQEPSRSVTGTSLFYLTEQLRVAEREKRVLVKHFTTNEAESDPVPPSRICSGYLYASDRHRPLRGERERPTFPR